jgi:hypothetical protein
VPLPECRTRSPQGRGEARFAVVARHFLAFAAIDVEQQAAHPDCDTVAITLGDASTMQHPEPAMAGG